MELCDLTRPQFPRPRLIWGVQEGCERIPELDKILDRDLYKAGLDPWLLEPKPSACLGEDCARRVQRSCPSAQGKVLGGRLYRSSDRRMTRLRMWAYHAQTQSTTYADTFCQECNLPELIPQQARHLLGQSGRKPLLAYIPPSRPAPARILSSDAISSSTELLSTTAAKARPGGTAASCG
jgi:hypothetical protein